MMIPSTNHKPNDINILIADDHPIFRHGLRQVIARVPHLKVVAEAANGVEALEKIAALSIQVAVLDIDMPLQDGFAVTRAVRAQKLPVAIIFLTMHQDEHFLTAALDAGVSGYVLKDSAVTEIIGSIQAVAAGQSYISPQLSGWLIKRTRPASNSPLAQLASLTPAERKVLKMLTTCATSKEIADQLCLSPRTIENHRARIAEKLALKGPSMLLKFAFEHKAHL